jgi:hypothetical protein
MLLGKNFNYSLKKVTYKRLFINKKATRLVAAPGIHASKDQAEPT